MARVALLWHMHQPDYRDPRTGVPVMPWTRLHALRGYRDMAIEIVEDGAPSTVNLVPSLLDQLLHYAAGGADPHLDLSARPADSLDHEAVRAIRATFVCGNPVMIESQPAYAKLAARARSEAPLDAGSLRDLQVWSTLAWFGATALRDYPALRALRARGRDFTEDDKATMLAVQAEILADLPARLSALATCGHAELSTSPYFHPILPLLVDVRHARRCMPQVPDDLEFAWPEDALAQLTLARDRCAQVLGSRPVGLWPSEGSVSPEVVELAGRAGFQWLATDGGVLDRSDRQGGGWGGWELGHGVRGFFRDRDLSDRIGFRYSTRPGEAAAAELLGEAKARAGERGLIPVVLDGENPWEAFPDAGRAFRAALHRGLREGPVRGATFAQACAEPPVGVVRRLHTGSWIGADFRIWYGHPEDRAAWRQLALARRAVEAAPEAERRAALPHIYAAEGSDWTWWYGDDFDTPFAGTFDALFRAHLAAAWSAIGREAPEDLAWPIAAPSQLGVEAPVSTLATNPGLRAIDWMGAGRVSLRGGSMARGIPDIVGIRFGFDALGALWVRLERHPEAPPTAALAVEVSVDDRRAEPVQAGPEGWVLRLEAPRAPGVGLLVRVRDLADGAERARLPEHGRIVLPVPARAARAAWWV